MKIKNISLFFVCLMTTHIIIASNNEGLKEWHDQNFRFTYHTNRAQETSEHTTLKQKINALEQKWKQEDTSILFLQKQRSLQHILETTVANFQEHCIRQEDRIIHEPFMNELEMMRYNLLHESSGMVMNITDVQRKKTENLDIENAADNTLRILYTYKSKYKKSLDTYNIIKSPEFKDLEKICTRIKHQNNEEVA